MSDPFLEKCRELAGDIRRVDLPEASDWAWFEAETGLRLPKYYKEFVSYFGSGRFGNSLEFTNPAAREGRFRLSADCLRSFGEGVEPFAEELGFKLFPHEHGCLTVAHMDRRQLLLSPDEAGEFLRLMWWDLDFDTVEVLNETIASFVYKLYMGELEVPWAAEIRAGIWWDKETPFFTPVK